MALNFQQQPLRVAKTGRFFQRLQNLAFRFCFRAALGMQQAGQLEMRLCRVWRVEQQQFSIGVNRFAGLPGGGARLGQRGIRRGNQRVDGQQYLSVL